MSGELSVLTRWLFLYKLGLLHLLRFSRCLPIPLGLICLHGIECIQIHGTANDCSKVRGEGYA